MNDTNCWYQDFSWAPSGVTVKETGAYIPFNTSLVKDIGLWLPYYVIETLRNMGRKHTLSVSFSPSPPRPWYLLPMAFKRAGARFVSPQQPSDISVYFEDTTQPHTPQPIDHIQEQARPHASLHLNHDCTDISKSRVAEVFEEVFGYALNVNPLHYDGPMVCKSEYNGTHDGQIISGPTQAKPDQVYQYVIDNSTSHGTVRDLRCPTLKGDIPLVYVKERPINQRFANLNSSCYLSNGDNHFSADELKKISQFCQIMRLDWGGLDILRDNKNGKIYIVDVNKTDMGPPLALPMRDKLKSTTLLAHALLNLWEERAA